MGIGGLLFRVPPRERDVTPFELLSTLVFAASSLLLLYLIAGYPVFLAWQARRTQRPVRKDAVLRPVSVVIAVHNGAQFAAEKLNSILALDYPRELMQILVVSDGCTDRTDEIVRGYENLGVELWSIPRSGKAAALNLGIANARNEILILTDIRQRLAPDSLRNLVACFGDPAVGAVSGELSILRGETAAENDIGLYWRYEVWIRKNMSAIDSTFGCNGPFYGLRRNLAVPIPLDNLLDDVYLPLAGFFAGYRLILEPSAKAYDYPTALKSEFRRKVRTQAGLLQILQLYPQMLSAANRMRLHFVSAKFGRALVPWLLLLVAIASFGLPAPFARWMLAAQGACYFAALIDPLVPGWLPLKRLTSLMRTFLVLALSSLVALRVLFVPPRELWKETQVRKINL